MILINLKERVDFLILKYSLTMLIIITVIAFYRMDYYCFRLCRQLLFNYSYTSSCEYIVFWSQPRILSKRTSLFQLKVKPISF